MGGGSVGNVGNGLRMELNRAGEACLRFSVGVIGNAHLLLGADEWESEQRQRRERHRLYVLRKKNRSGFGGDEDFVQEVTDVQNNENVGGDEEESNANGNGQNN